jgi:hypothetical protein
MTQSRANFSAGKFNPLPKFPIGPIGPKTPQLNSRKAADYLSRELLGVEIFELASL